MPFGSVRAYVQKRSYRRFGRLPTANAAACAHSCTYARTDPFPRLIGSQFYTMNEQQEAVLVLLGSERYEEALSAIEKLEPSEQQHGRILIARGDAYYELGQDLKALRVYVEYARIYPTGRGIDFALFGIAMCLKNLDMQVESLVVLGLVSPSHQGLQKEIEHSSRIITEQREAKDTIADVLARAAPQ